jgi:hypothetical protein
MVEGHPGFRLVTAASARRWVDRSKSPVVAGRSMLDVPTAID